MSAPTESYFRMNTAHDLLLPCPACGENADADPGHHICLRCEGVVCEHGVRGNRCAACQEARLTS